MTTLVDLIYGNLTEIDFKLRNWREYLALIPDLERVTGVSQDAATERVVGYIGDLTGEQTALTSQYHAARAESSDAAAAYDAAWNPQAERDAAAERVRLKRAARQAAESSGS